MFAAPNTNTAYTASFEEVMFDMHTVEPVLAEMHAIHDTINDLNAVKFSFENYGVTKSAMAIIDKDGLLSSSIASVPAYESLVGDYAVYSTKAEGAVEGLVDTTKEQLAKFASAAAKGFTIVVEKLQAAGSAFIGWFSKKKEVVDKADTVKVSEESKLPNYAKVLAVAGIATVAAGVIAVFFPKVIPTTKDAVAKHWKAVMDKMTGAKLTVAETHPYFKAKVSVKPHPQYPNLSTPFIESLEVIGGASNAKSWSGKFSELYKKVKSSFSMETFKSIVDSITKGLKSSYEYIKGLNGESLTVARQWLVDTVSTVWAFVRDNVIKAMLSIRKFFSKIKLSNGAVVVDATK